MAIRFPSNTAEHNSNLGTVRVFMGATQDLPITKDVDTDMSRFSPSHKPWVRRVMLVGRV